MAARSARSGQARTKTRRTKKARQFVVDEKGQPTAVLLSIEEYEDLIEAAEQRDDIRYLEKAKTVPGKPIPLEELETRLRAEGKLRYCASPSRPRRRATSGALPRR